MKRTEKEQAAIKTLEAIKENLQTQGYDIKITMHIRDKLTQEIDEIVI
jgi:hypothetical protein